jgi:polar amino acid transport system substrate-binding protein
MEIHYRVNFGEKVDNAMSNTLIGGGRIHGAGCHYVDLIEYIVGSKVTHVSAASPMFDGNVDLNTFVATLHHEDGSIASLVFTSEGKRKNDTKEEIFISCQGHNARLVDFQELRLDRKKYRYFRHRYGALDTMRKFIYARNQNEAVPVSLSDGINATIVTLAIEKSIHNNGNIETLAGDTE